MSKRRRLIDFLEGFETNLNAAILCDDEGAARAARAFGAAFVESDHEGVRAMQNDDTLVRAIVERCTFHRELGARALRLEGIDSTPVDQDHVMARVHWLGEYRQPDGTDVAVPFENVYLIRTADREMSIVAAVSGDERRQLEARGLTR